ncbi:hypothetical protein KIW84_053111 [Lathyrus oleraceus]|uniref:Reverse transcriptase n=1 Tax=Pisum sativum TaxID=3888 RepID=A0A9D4WPG0_PEA|nr:hypothetical protein KIW84_053111 [Pisum sativum]
MMEWAMAAMDMPINVAVWDKREWSIEDADMETGVTNVDKAKNDLHHDRCFYPFHDHHDCFCGHHNQYDNLIFYQAEEQEAKTLIKIIKKYQDNPGQKINLQKSQMMFSRSTINPKGDIFTNLLGILMTNKINTYLSLPTAIGKSKTRSFNFLLDRIRKKLYIWKANTISYASRAAVIKAVAQAIPTYVMSFFLLPKSIGKKIDNLDARFW